MFSLNVFSFLKVCLNWRSFSQLQDLMFKRFCDLFTEKVISKLDFNFFELHTIISIYLQAKTIE